ncbi:MAG TPA: leucine/isoleucine/valine transporter permease subunit [Candidatus Limnocylindria bacterium]|nr:leucine/isoleucine/valine transporter permease subunit [Candidatus Limnocylindria bacterium]
MSASLRRSAAIGLVGGVVNIHASLVGMITAFRSREFVVDVITLGALIPLLVSFVVAWIAVRRLTRSEEDQSSGGVRLLHGIVAGGTSTLVLAVLLLLISAFNISGMFINATGQLVSTLHFDFDLVPGTIALLVAGAVAAAIGASLHVLPSAIARAVTTALTFTMALALMEPFVAAVLDNIGLGVVERFIFAKHALTIPGAIVALVGAAAVSFGWRRAGKKATEKRLTAARRRNPMGYKIAAFGIVAVLLLLLPQLVGERLAFVINQIGIYVLLGLGLNIVVGFAGLLDLGYVAFYAVGAYTIGILTSPASAAFAPQISFWAALPAVVVIAATIGLMVGAPVLRLRGDYLAIVTLGFGEIARIIFLSEWAAPVTGGAQGILSIPPPPPFPREQQLLYYPILLFCIIAALGALSLSESRVGRAWNAMREDETAAEATGVSTVKYKLLAFGLGAAFGCLSGALFAAWIGSIFANSFEILVSINALALIILGGMGNIVGVIVGAFVLVGLPELLREFADYRLLLYGAILVTMMILRPEGLLPSRARQSELHEREDTDDEALGAAAANPAVTT